MIEPDLLFDNDNSHDITIHLKDFGKGDILIDLIVDGASIADNPEEIYNYSTTPALFLMLKMMDVITSSSMGGIN